MFPILKDTNCFVFFSTQMVQCLLRWQFSIVKKLLMKLISYLALVNPKTGNVLQNLSKCSCKSLNWFFFAFVETVLNCSWNYRLVLQNRHNEYDVDLMFLGYMQVHFFAVSFRKKFIFIWALLSVAKFSKASKKNDTRSRILGSQRKMGSCIKLDDIDTVTGHVVKEFVIVCAGITKRVTIVLQCFAELIHVLWAHVFNPSTANFQTPLHVSSFNIEIITRWARIDFKKSINTGYIANMTYWT